MVATPKRIAYATRLRPLAASGAPRMPGSIISCGRVRRAQGEAAAFGPLGLLGGHRCARLRNLRLRLRLRSRSQRRAISLREIDRMLPRRALLLVLLGGASDEGLHDDRILRGDVDLPFQGIIEELVQVVAGWGEFDFRLAVKVVVVQDELLRNDRVGGKRDLCLRRCVDDADGPALGVACAELQVEAPALVHLHTAGRQAAVLDQVRQSRATLLGAHREHATCEGGIPPKLLWQRRMQGQLEVCAEEERDELAVDDIQRRQDLVAQAMAAVTLQDEAGHPRARNVLQHFHFGLLPSLVLLGRAGWDGELCRKGTQ